jgi:trimeric autotransporter adhesin
LNRGVSSGPALSVYGDEAIWYNDTYFSWGYGGTWNYFRNKTFIGSVAADPGANMLVVNGAAAKPGGGSWSTWSDIRLKNIQGNYEKGLKEISLLQPVKFTYKAGNPCNLPSDQNYVGFVAQEVQKVFPEAVSEGNDGYLTLDANAINVAMVNAFKELKAENDQLKLESEKLKSENELLKSKNEQIESRLTSIEKIIGASAMK